MIARRDPDARGYFGEFGGRFVPETLVEPVEALERAYFDFTGAYAVYHGPGVLLNLVASERSTGRDLVAMRHLRDFVRPLAESLSPGSNGWVQPNAIFRRHAADRDPQRRSRRRGFLTL